MSLACFPWYDLAETQAATDRLWQEVAGGLIERGVPDVPPALDRRADYEAQWRSQRLLVGQACGYDVYCANDHQLQVVAVPRYAMAGCEGTRYRSFVIVREDSQHECIEDLRGSRCVINSPRSHSGMNVLQALVAPHAVDGRFFKGVQISGAHERSLELIRLGHADVAAIDCITYGLLQRHRESALANTRIVHRTGAVTAPPYVTSSRTSADTIALLFSALEQGIAALSEGDRADLGLHGIEPVSLDDYRDIAHLAEAAWDESYRELSSEPAQASLESSS